MDSKINPFEKPLEDPWHAVWNRSEINPRCDFPPEFGGRPLCALAISVGTSSTNAHSISLREPQRNAASSSGRSRPLIFRSQMALNAGSLEIIQKADRLWVVQPHLPAGADADQLQRDLLSQLCRDRSIELPVRWYYTPMAFGFSRHVPASAVVYDCMDELSSFLGAPPELLDHEAQLLEAADLVFTGGLRLFEGKTGSPRKRPRLPKLHRRLSFRLSSHRRSTGSGLHPASSRRFLRCSR